MTSMAVAHSLQLPSWISWLPNTELNSIDFFWSLGMDLIENAILKSSFRPVSHAYPSDRLENTIPLLLFTAIT
jgi:hypothetical protein